MSPKRGQKHNLLLLVEENAKASFENRFLIQRLARQAVLERVQKELGLSEPPQRIEAFDISNIQGAESVASMVVCEQGVMKRSEYRKFRIRSVEGADDFASIFEVVHRRYSRLLEEERPFPDLVLIDGGKGQLHSAFQALQGLGIEDVNLASIAKREEVIFIQGQDEPLVLERDSPVLHLCRRSGTKRTALLFSTIESGVR